MPSKTSENACYAAPWILGIILTILGIVRTGAGVSIESILLQSNRGMYNHFLSYFYIIIIKQDESGRAGRVQEL